MRGRAGRPLQAVAGNGACPNSVCPLFRSFVNQLGLISESAIGMYSACNLGVIMSGKSVSFDDFCKKFGFVEYPFNSYTSENEVDRAEALFINTSLYSPIVQAFDNKQTVLLTGDRGTGKTAIIYDFMRRLNSKDAITVSIDDFSSLPEEYSSVQFYEFLTRHLSEELFKKIASDKKSGSKLSRDDRVLLSYYYARFTNQATKNVVVRKVSDLQNGFATKVGVYIYNILKVPVNMGANLTVHFVGNLISRSMGLTEPPHSWNDYFPELTINVDNDFHDAEGSFEALVRLTELSKKVGYTRVVFAFDKVDEDSRLGNAAEKISLFIKPILTDNKFLLSGQFQVIIALWVIPFNMLRDQTRTQKLYSPIIQWDSGDLITAFDRRVAVFSRSERKHFDIISSSLDGAGRSKFLSLSNKNPRDLWHLCDKVFRAQYRIDSSSANISKEAFELGMDDFVKGFNFYEYYPRPTRAKSNSLDVYSYAKHLLKLKGSEFTKNQLNEAAGIGSSIHNYVAGMRSMGLIEESGNSGGSTTYSIRDPKIVHALDRGIEISKNA